MATAAPFGERLRGGASDAAPGAGDERDLARELMVLTTTGGA
jgi:hypothetical protein